MRAPLPFPLTAVLLLACAAGCAAPAATAASTPAAEDAMLDDLRWKVRPIVLIAPADDDPRLRQARGTIAAAANGFARRDMALKVVTAAGHPLRARFGITGGAFAAILVGKDGGEKARVERLTDLEPWFALVDSMPMRQREMRERGEVSP